MSLFRGAKRGDAGAAAGGPLDYDSAKELARHADPAVRLELARRADAQPEVLYYLAKDAAAEVRREIAGNPAAPRQADLLLAADGNPTVRHAVACKIAAIASIMRSGSIMPCGPPKPRKAVFDTVLVRRRREVRRNAG